MLIFLSWCYIIYLQFKNHFKEDAVKKFFAAMLALILLALPGCDSFFDWQYSGMSHYSSDRKSYAHADEILPDKDSIKEYIDINYTYRHASEKGIDYSSGLALFIKYNTDTFSKWNADISSRYTYLEGDSEKYPGLPFCSFSYKNYDMKIVPLCEGEDACRYFGIVGISTTKNRICILFYSNENGTSIEGDNIEEAYISLIESSFYWY